MMCGERAERVEAGEERGRQPAPERVEPQGRGPGDDADPVVGPDRVPVADALDVVPHAVGVDDVAARVLR